MPIMRAEVTTVPQTQVQYQTSELLIGAIAHGYRIAERPIVMRKRTSGVSKKGPNALYGTNRRSRCGRHRGSSLLTARSGMRLERSPACAA